MTNYQAYSPSRDEYCGHMHHSSESVKRCADHLGWEDAIVSKIDKNDFKKHVGAASNMLDPSTMFEAYITISIKADCEADASDIATRLSKSMSKYRTVADANVVGVKRLA